MALLIIKMEIRIDLAFFRTNGTIAYRAHMKITDGIKIFSNTRLPAMYREKCG